MCQSQLKTWEWSYAYLRSDPFVELVRSGYIGTRGGATDHLRYLIEAALTGGRAVIAAIQSAMGKRDI